MISCHQQIVSFTSSLPVWIPFTSFSFLYLSIFPIYLFFGGASGLSCGVWDLCWGTRDLSLWRAVSSLQCLGFSLVAALGLLSSCGAQAPERVSSVVCSTWALSLKHASSIVVVRSLSCPVACGILVPRPGIEPASLPLEGRFFTTGPTGKSPLLLFLVCLVWLRLRILC